jgi:hypothetical protein
MLVGYRLGNRKEIEEMLALIEVRRRRLWKDFHNEDQKLQEKAKWFQKGLDYLNRLSSDDVVLKVEHSTQAEF